MVTASIHQGRGERKPGLGFQRSKNRCRFVVMIVVTGAAGFIGSALLGELQRMGYGDLIAVDDFSIESKSANNRNKRITQFVERREFFGWLSDNAKRIQFIFHIGARTRTDEFDEDLLEQLNVSYSKQIWQACVDFNIPLIYASSAATYGDGTQGFSDEPALLGSLKPLNPYGNSKHRFDLWVIEQQKVPPFWAGFKFFNVFGPNEYHKGRMASVVFHAFHQIKETGQVSLFRSHNENFANGAQERDFIYVKDVLSVMMHFLVHRTNCGLYNLGTGTCRTFEDLATAVFAAMELPPDINFVDMPLDIRDKYQYHTQANMDKLVGAGYKLPFTPLETAVDDYVKNYLISGQYL